MICAFFLRTDEGYESMEMFSFNFEMKPYDYISFLKLR